MNTENSSSFHFAFKEEFLRTFPVLENKKVDFDLLVSPQRVSISSESYNKIAESIKAAYALSTSTAYVSRIGAKSSELFASPSNNPSILMSYDFHIDEKGEPYLIEINTNASGFLLSAFISDFTAADGKPVPCYKTISDAIEELRLTIENDFVAGGGAELKNIAIVDEDPPQQKMYFEFLMYESLFQNWSCQAKILDISEVTYDPQTRFARNPKGEKIDFIYNRFTDFTLSEGRSSELRKSLLSGKTVFSPNSKTYLLLADKERLTEWGQAGFLESMNLSPVQAEALRKVLLENRLFSDFADEKDLWAHRKKYFFKPLRSHGGKSAYRGSSLSRKVFERIIHEPFLAQEFVPPTPIDDLWKYDLRFFVYRDQIQAAIARVFQGQTTNFREKGGGFAPIFFGPEKK